MFGRIVIICVTVFSVFAGSLAAADFGDRIWQDKDGNKYIRWLHDNNTSTGVSDRDLENAGKHNWRTITLANGDSVDITVQNGVNNCSTIAFVNTLLSLGEPKDDPAVMELLSQPYSISWHEAYDKKYKTVTKWFSNMNGDRPISKPDGVFQEMLAGWKQGKAYEIGIATRALPSDMKSYEGGNFIVSFTPEYKGFETFNTSPHAVFVVGFTTNSKGENVMILDKHGKDVYVFESGFTWSLGKSIMTVTSLEKIGDYVPPIKPIQKREPPKQEVVSARITKPVEITHLPLFEATYKQKLASYEPGSYKSPGNCQNVAVANACASLIGKQKWLDDLSVKHYIWFKDGENPIQDFASTGVEPEFKENNLTYQEAWHENPDLYVQEGLSSFEPLDVWNEMIVGMCNDKRYILAIYDVKLVGADTDNKPDTWDCSNHAIYVEGFSRNSNGDVVMQLDRYGRDFRMTLDQFVAAFGGMSEIHTIVKK